MRKKKRVCNLSIICLSGTADAPPYSVFDDDRLCEHALPHRDEGDCSNYRKKGYYNGCHYLNEIVKISLVGPCRNCVVYHGP